jgi:hypothetical protein
MPNIPYRDILIGARQEAFRMRHFFVGVEHLFIALLEIRGSLTAKLMQEYGLAPEYVIDAIRRKMGKGSKQRLWAGIPNTPRVKVLENIAYDIALEAGRDEVYERDLLVAMLDERDSVPLRVIYALGITNFDVLRDMAQNYTLNSETQQTYVKVDFGTGFNRDEMLNKDQLFVLRRMFADYPQIRVEHRLTGGYSQATLLVVTPIRPDQQEDATVAVKIHQVDSILDEAQRYESHVKAKLPPMTARIEDKPTAPDSSDLAGIKYTLITQNNQPPRDLRAILNEWEADKLSQWLTETFFPTFGRMWWSQNREFRFQVWREYDWLLPPILTLELVKDKPLPPNAYVLRMPVKRAKLNRLDFGDMVAVENFVVQKVYAERHAIQLAVGQGTDSASAYKIEIRGIDFNTDTYYRGEVVENIIGTVWQTRGQQLMNAVRALIPDFDAHNEKIPVNVAGLEKVPNPILMYEGLLDSFVNGTSATIHGDLHPGNIMIGPKESAFLIDFAHTREGHTIFDWATLEISLLNDYIMPYAGESWNDARRVIGYLQKLNGGEIPADIPEPLHSRIIVLRSLRDIVRKCLANENQWSEYYIALTFCSLRALTWETVSLAGRRLMVLVGGLSIHELRTRFRPSDDNTEDTEDTYRSF